MNLVQIKSLSGRNDEIIRSDDVTVRCAFLVNFEGWHTLVQSTVGTLVNYTSGFFPLQFGFKDFNGGFSSGRDDPGRSAFTATLSTSSLGHPVFRTQSSGGLCRTSGKEISLLCAYFNARVGKIVARHFTAFPTATSDTVRNIVVPILTVSSEGFLLARDGLSVAFNRKVDGNVGTLHGRRTLFNVAIFDFEVGSVTFTSVLSRSEDTSDSRTSSTITALGTFGPGGPLGPHARYGSVGASLSVTSGGLRGISGVTLASKSGRRQNGSVSGS